MALPSAEAQRDSVRAGFPTAPAARPTRKLQQQPMLPATGGRNRYVASAFSGLRHSSEPDRRARPGQWREFTSWLTMQLWLPASLSPSWVWLLPSRLPVPPPLEQPSTLRSSSAPQPFVPRARQGRRQPAQPPAEVQERWPGAAQAVSERALVQPLLQAGVRVLARIADWRTRQAPRPHSRQE